MMDPRGLQALPGLRVFRDLPARMVSAGQRGHAETEVYLAPKAKRESRDLVESKDLRVLRELRAPLV